MIVVCARESPRSAIISTRSRKLSLYRRYQRTQSTMVSWSKCRPLKSRPFSCALVSSVVRPICQRLCCVQAVRTRAVPRARRGRARGLRLVADTGLYICRRRSRHAAFLRPQTRRPSIDGWGVGRSRGGGSHRGSPCPVLSAELAISRIPTSCFARAVVPTRTEGARFASSLAGSHARPGFLGAGGFPFRDPEVQRDTRSR